MRQYAAGSDTQDESFEEDHHDYEDEVDEMLSEVVSQEEEED